MNILTRIGLWFGSMLLSVAVFSLVFGMVVNGGGALPLIFRVTMLCALPAWCLYLPVVVILKDAEEGRGRVILLSGTLIGPISIVLWCLLLQLRGRDPEGLWNGDPLIGIGGIWGSIFGLIVGFVTACSYTAALKILHRRFSQEGHSA